MKWVDTTAIAAKMVQLKAIWNHAVRSFVVKPMRDNQFRANPKTRVSIRLSNREIDTPGELIRFGLRPISPCWNLRVITDAAVIFCLAHWLQVVRIAASSVAAKMVKRFPLGDSSESLLPVPPVSEPEFAVATDTTVSVNFVARQFPTTRNAIDFWNNNRAVSVSVLAGLSCDVPQPTLPSKWRLCTASTFAKPAWVAELSDLQLTVAPHESEVASLDCTATAIVRDRRFLAASTLAKATWVWAARIVGPQYFTSATSYGASQSGIVPFDETGLRGKNRAASALASAQKSARIGVGHLISCLDRWSWLVECFRTHQPFQYNAEGV